MAPPPTLHTYLTPSPLPGGLAGELRYRVREESVYKD